MAERCKASVCHRSFAGIAASNVAGGREEYMCVPCECCVLSGRGFCDGLIVPPDEYYRVRFVCV